MLYCIVRAPKGLVCELNRKCTSTRENDLSIISLC
jgi:hypothetical protein